MGPGRDLHPQPMPSQGTALLLSYQDQNEEVRACTSEAVADVIHGRLSTGSFEKRKNSRSLLTPALCRSGKRTRVLKIQTSRGPIFYSRRLIQEIEHLIGLFTMEWPTVWFISSCEAFSPTAPKVGSVIIQDLALTIPDSLRPSSLPTLLSY